MLFLLFLFFSVEGNLFLMFNFKMLMIKLVWIHSGKTGHQYKVDNGTDTLYFNNKINKALKIVISVLL